MRRHRLSPILLLAGLLLGSAPLRAQEFPFTHYTQEREVNPLPGATVTMTYQDRLGFVWMVLYSAGLVRYDGHTMQRYLIADGLHDLDVREIMEDSFGRLWVSSEAGLVVSTRPLDAYGPNERVAFTSGIGSRRLHSVAVGENRLCLDTRGRLLLGTRDAGIIRYSFPALDSLLLDTLRASGKDGVVRDVRGLSCGADGTVWAAVSGGALIVYPPDGGTPEVLDRADGVPAGEPEGIMATASGAVVVGNAGGLVWRVDAGEDGRTISTVSTLLTSRVTGLREAPDGVIWVSSEGSGLLMVPPAGKGAPRRLVRRNGLLSDNVNDVMIDREGNTWVAQLGGVSKLRPDYLAHLSYTAVSHGGAPPHLPDPGVGAVVPAVTVGGMTGTWVGTSGGGVAFLRDDGEVEVIDAARGLMNNWVNAVALDNRGRIWIGGAPGMHCLSFDEPPPASPSRLRRSVTVLGKRATLAAYRPITVYGITPVILPSGVEGNGRIQTMWFTAYQGVYCFTGEEWLVFRVPSGIPATYFTTIAADSGGYVWIGTRDEGLFRSSRPLTLAGLRDMPSRESYYRPDEGGGVFGREILAPAFEKVWDESRGAPSNQIEGMIYRRGLLWIGTPEGVVAVDPSTMRLRMHVQQKDGLPGADATAIACGDAGKTLWVGTNGGLAAVDPKSGRVTRALTKADGLVDNEVWFYGSVAATGDGTVYFGTSKGLALYNPAHDRRNTVPPVLRLTDVQFTEDLSGNAVSFEFAALSYTNEQLVRYRARLNGYDREWSPEVATYTLRYTNLPAFLFPRTYTLQVQAKNNDGVWSTTPLSYSFSVQPPWWFSWWWMASNLVLIGAGSYGFLRYRTRQLERRSRELERTVEERTHEIREKAAQISKQKDELAGKNAALEDANAEILRTQEQLIMQEKLASLGALTAGIAHEIKNPLNFVNNFSEVSVDITQELQEDIAAVRDKLEPKLLKRIEANLDDLSENARKINEHGKRADGIVKGMLEHSRGKSGERGPTDVNKLVDEYATLAYHGMVAQDPTLAVKLEKELDPEAGVIEAVAQDLSRALLNIVNNACYATIERKGKAGADFVPTVRVSTKAEGETVVVRIRDNGTGIPKSVVSKIFQPFFTTKPTGKGTGLGLSITHDIVVKQHGGRLEVQSEEGSHTEFVLTLPRSSKTVLKPA